MHAQGEAARGHLGLHLSGHLAALPTWAAAVLLGEVAVLAREGDGIGGLATVLLGWFALIVAAVALALTLVAVVFVVGWCRDPNRPDAPALAVVHLAVAWIAGAGYVLVQALA